jgi:hypothetical protein
MKSPDELSRELSTIAKTHPHHFFSFLLIDAAEMIRHLANLPPIQPAAIEAAPREAPERQGRPALKRRHDGSQEAPAAPSGQQKGLFV